MLCCRAWPESCEQHLFVICRLFFRLLAFPLLVIALVVVIVVDRWFGINRKQTTMSDDVDDSGVAVVTQQPSLPKHKCSSRFCRFPSSTNVEQYPCFVEACTKGIHLECYRHFVLKKNNVPHFHPDTDETYVVCNKRHYNIAARSIVSSSGTSTSSTGWNQDGKDPKNPEIASDAAIPSSLSRNFGSRR